MANVIQMTAKLPPRKPVTYGAIKNNRWVLYKGKIGIITDMEDSGHGLFNAVDEAGFTYAVIPVDFTQVVLAAWSQIPEARRPSLEAAIRLGYAELPTIN